MRREGWGGELGMGRDGWGLRLCILGTRASFEGGVFLWFERFEDFAMGGFGDEGFDEEVGWMGDWIF